ncbi:hypothetical protein PSV08DRAFT_378296 [Bipolaris maydis]|uniref:uncharacterized protein n=1 Tax=Cochliobolus heterostrophus TaxID=5016 RepID=UPI0024D9CF2C|nr:hypothetical protein J3E73DRAFT_399027 [Bipolaris maydis]KAJ6268230.1 hypothetical protein PSV08DRAFT_378296 [Bipolaris maydis]KAJ6278481.1 hypothetical protein J3E71DRAFT_355510 [Bipolaris maydis]
MELTGFDLFALFLCSSIFGLLVSVWSKSELISGREMTLVVAVFVGVVAVLFTQFSTSRALADFLSKDVSSIHRKQLEDLTEAHGHHTAGLKSEHYGAHLRLLNKINDANARFDRIYNEYEQMSTKYQEQMRNMQEKEDRIRYLETRLGEFGQSRTSIARIPLSAPATQISFMKPPRGQRFNEGNRWPPWTGLLPRVVEAEDE